MPLHYDLNRDFIQPRRNKDDIALVKAHYDPAHETVLSDEPYHNNSLAIHVLPRSDLQETLIVQRDDGQCAMWTGPFLDEGEWIEAPPLEK